MNGSCDGKVALVTGTSRGLGKAIAQRLAARRRDGRAHRAHDGTRPQISRLPSSDARGDRSRRRHGVAIQADLSKAEDRERLFAEVVERVGAPDILVNNAAVTFLRPLDEFPDRRVRLMMEMHVLAPLHLTQLAIPAMRERGRGWILNVTSVGGESARGPTVLRVRSHGGLRCLRHGQGGAQPADEKPCGRTVRRRDRRQRRRADQPGRDAGCGHAGPGQDRHRGHRADHPDRFHAVHRRSQGADRTDRAHAGVSARGRLVDLTVAGGPTRCPIR